MARTRPHRRTLALHTRTTRPLAFLVALGRALGAGTDHEAVDRCAALVGIPAVTLFREIASGTLANLPTHAVRTLMQVARELPNMPHVEIGDLSPLDPEPVRLMLTAARR